MDDSKRMDPFSQRKRKQSYNSFANPSVTWQRSALGLQAQPSRQQSQDEPLLLVNRD